MLSGLRFMSFESFDSAVDGFCEFLALSSWPTSLRWLIKSRCRYLHRTLYVYRPDALTDSKAHRKRFDLAIQRNKNIAFIAYADLNGNSLVGLETTGLDPPHSEFDESRSHNYKTLESPLKLISVDSPLAWQLTKLFVRNNHPTWKCIGWPA